MIPVFDPQVTAADIDAVMRALKKGEISGSFGEALAEFEQEFAAYCGTAHAIAVTSGTTALHLAVAALELPPGSEILVSASTNVATALAAYHNGCVPIPVDSERTTWNLDLALIEHLITPNTRAIIPVHLFGHPVDMDALTALADSYGLVVIEDCAESLGATCRGKQTGGFGALGCFSFYANKVITTGEGGMVTTNDGEIAQQLRLLRNLAFSEPRFVHHKAGFNFRMTNYQAAMGLEQLRRIDSIVRTKRQLADMYRVHLSDVEGIQLPAEASWAVNIYWMFSIVVQADFPISRDDLAARLRSADIDTRTFFCPISQQPFLERQPGHRDVPCPVADELWETGMYLPSSLSLAQEDVKRICDEIKAAARS